MIHFWIHWSNVSWVSSQVLGKWNAWWEQGGRHQNQKLLSIIIKYVKLGKGSQPKQKQEDVKNEREVKKKEP